MSRKIQWLLILLVSISCGFGYKQLQSYLVQPDAVLVLGGHEEREKFAAELGKRYPHLDIWVSGGSPQDYVKRIFATRGIKGDRLHLDYRASDTVTNFTTLVDELEAQGIDSVYLITSENHMTRARIIGEIVFGSRGIVLKPLAVPSSYPPEPIEKSVRDCARSILWLATGNSLAVTRKE
ncbi:hypothetical protein Xen7305DRAFT_00028320 [Xenococcus sp. PCC 7305]|uniref:YdcF family protein n=1 Tax=Xenococcus sp. PCC 7305 TaxID=102125 RepID=UPI0002AC5328|nr:YdcF family protein [Xenococcus sp. PCC 7305]ELS03112.1 hypothetical protein Xen7305DRAFT_00028320 [Xenococcus sp. PCC 7305]